MKSIIVTSFLLLIASIASAQGDVFVSANHSVHAVEIAPEQEKPNTPVPKPVAQSRPADKTFWLATAPMVGSGAALKIGGDICRRNNGVEPCTEHYGEYNAATGIVWGIEALAGPGIFHMCRKDYNNSRWCWMIPGIIIGGNMGWGIHESQIHHPDLTPDHQGILRRR